MTEATERAAVVAAARSWLGTPYHHAADVKGAGIDCAMLLVRVYCDLGLVEPFDPRPYPPDWMLHRDDERYLDVLLKHAVEVERPEPGDVVVWRHGRSFSHGAIVVAWPQVIHAFAPARVVEPADVSLSALLSDPKRPRRFFSYWRSAALANPERGGRR